MLLQSGGSKVEFGNAAYQELNTLSSNLNPVLPKPQDVLFLTQTPLDVYFPWPPLQLDIYATLLQQQGAFFVYCSISERPL